MEKHKFTMRDPDDYPLPLINDILKMAEEQGHPMEAGSYIEQMTIRQLDNLVHGRTDA